MGRGSLRRSKAKYLGSKGGTAHDVDNDESLNDSEDGFKYNSYEIIKS